MVVAAQQRVSRLSLLVLLLLLLVVLLLMVLVLLVGPKWLGCVLAGELAGGVPERLLSSVAVALHLRLAQVGAQGEPEVLLLLLAQTQTEAQIVQIVQIVQVAKIVQVLLLLVMLMLVVVVVILVLILVLINLVDLVVQIEVVVELVSGVLLQLLGQTERRGGGRVRLRLAHTKVLWRGGAQVCGVGATEAVQLQAVGLLEIVVQS